jgi:AbrB family looped-hinge helix DNA binding protein
MSSPSVYRKRYDENHALTTHLGMNNMKYMTNPDKRDRAISMATLGERGQVVIPAAIREQLSLQAGDKLMVFTKHQELICLIPASSMRHLAEVLNAQLAEIDDENQPKQES